MCLARFASWPEENLVLVVGTAQALSFYPRQVDGGPLIPTLILAPWWAAPRRRYPPPRARSTVGRRSLP
jgi:hypothetical protein